jgi:hypothetical protein
MDPYVRPVQPLATAQIDGYLDDSLRSTVTQGDCWAGAFEG